MPVRPPPRPPADPNAFDEAVTWFRDRLVMTDQEFESIQGASHATAFTVAGVAQLSMVAQVWEAADRALAQGETLESFQKAMRQKLAAAWGRDMPWRVETIYRTNVQVAYSRGRWDQMTHPAVLKARPFRKYSAIMDSRTTSVCSACDGVVRPADDPWWQTHVPPLHHNCRSHLVTLSEAEAQREGVAPAAPADADPDEGFGDAPKPGKVWTPNLTPYPPPLVQVYTQPTKPKAPPPPPPAPAPAPPPPAAPGALKPWVPATSPAQALKQLRDVFDVEPLDGKDMRKMRDRLTGGRRRKRIDESMLPRKVKPDELLLYLNELGATLHELADKYPAMRSAMKGLKIAGSPVARGAYFPSLDFMSASLFDATRWEYFLKFNDQLPEKTATKWHDDHLVKSSAPSTVRHEMGHVLDRRMRSAPGSHFATEEATGFGKQFADTIAAEAKAAGQSRPMWLRRHVSTYATQDPQEALAELVTLFTSPGYKAGMLPKKLEALLSDALAGRIP